MQRSRNFYDTFIIYLFINGKESILPAEMLSHIPASTRSTWRSYSADMFFGRELRSIFDQSIRTTELFMKYKHLKKVLAAVEAIYIALAGLTDVVKKPFYELRHCRETVVDIIQQYQSLIGLDKLLAWFRISRSTYQNWLLQLKVRCSASFTFSCVRRYGSQLLKEQVELIRQALTCDAYKHWPITSIALHFQRTGRLHVSVNSWYKYGRLLGVVRKRLPRLKKTTGLVASRRNQYWHMDITHFTTSNGLKHFIYFLSDNFSRKILAWRLAFEVNWKYAKECIEEAHSLAVTIDNPLNLTIVTDGGPENTHHSLDEFIGSLAGNIKKSIALKDILFSNSPAEAKHHTFKSYYASEKDTENTSRLIEKIKFFVQDFNSLRPNYPLGGFTPDEVYFNQKPAIDFALLRRQDAINRKQNHRNTSCIACTSI